MIMTDALGHYLLDRLDEEEAQARAVLDADEGSFDGLSTDPESPEWMAFRLLGKITTLRRVIADSPADRVIQLLALEYRQRVDFPLIED